MNKKFMYNGRFVYSIPSYQCPRCLDPLLVDIQRSDGNDLIRLMHGPSLLGGADCSLRHDTVFIPCPTIAVMIEVDEVEP